MINLEGKKLILASKSPRRQELLRELNLSFEVKSKEVPEDFPSSLPPHQVAGYLSEKKAQAFENEIGDEEIVLTSDTIVVLEEVILGKPEGYEEAKKMLTSLSGRKHQVITAITIFSKQKKVTLQDNAWVTFKDLTDKEIDFYIQKYKPFDKAGAYGIQEWIGYVGVTRLEGSFYTVMGLPVHLVYQILSNW